MRPVAWWCPAWCLAALVLPLAARGSAALSWERTLRPAAEQPDVTVVSPETRLARRAGVDLELFLTSSGAEAAKVALYVPSGYAVNLGRPAGTRIGLVVVSVRGGSGYIGQLTVDDPGKYLGDPQAQSCAAGAHAGVWLLELKLPNHAVKVPAFVDPTAGAEAALGAFKARLCLPHSTLPSTLGLPLGTRIVEIDLLLSSVLTNPSRAGLYVWRAFLTPYTATGQADGAATFELRSVLPLPMRLALSGRFDRRSRRAILSGRLVAPSMSTSGIPVDLYAKSPGGNSRRVASTRTGGGGAYSFRRRIGKTLVFNTGTEGIRGCSARSSAPGGCVSETLAPASSRSVRVSRR